MANAPAQPRRRHPIAAFLAWLTVGLIRRAYAVVLIAIIVWLTYLAVRYLINTLIRAIPPPPQIVELPRRMDLKLIEKPWREWAAIGATQNPRLPPAHYHRFEGWLQPDAYNDCTRGGCHSVLPHSRNKAVRAFLNMHATSLHCGVCHVQTDQRPLDLTWYSLETGGAAGPPAALEAYGLLTSSEGQRRFAQPTPDDQRRLVALIQTAARQSGDVPALAELAHDLQAVRVTSDEFQKLLEWARAVLPQHFRGEYGEKLALRDGQGKPRLGHPDDAAAVDEYLSAMQRGEKLAGDQRKALLDRVHTRRRTQPLHCTQCHTAENSLIDFAKIGYPEARRQALFRPAVFQMIEHIAGGQPMYLPGFVLPAPETQPTTRPADSAPAAPPTQAAQIQGVAPAVAPGGPDPGP
jgi:hypothetical protein